MTDANYAVLMTIEPETKDWAWVISMHCDECGFDPASVRRDEIPDRIVASADGWAQVLARPDVAQRPNDHTWSPLEYACHVRDLSSVMTERLDSMLETQPVCFPDWDQDRAAEQADYQSQNPADIAEQITAATAGFAELYRLVDDAAWSRHGLRSDGTTFTVETLALYALHDLEHHRGDVGLPPRS